METGPSIRPVGRSDLAGLLALYAELNPADPPLAEALAVRRLNDILACPGMSILAAFEDDALVSTCTLVVIPNLTRGGAPYALIENVVTKSDQRRRGAGKAVLRHAIAQAFAQGCYKIMLLTGKKDPATHAFYAACGFRQDKTGYQVRNDAVIFKAP